MREADNGLQRAWQCARSVYFALSSFSYVSLLAKHPHICGGSLREFLHGADQHWDWWSHLDAVSACMHKAVRLA